MRNRTMIVAALLALGIVATACTTSSSSSGAAASPSSSVSSTPSPTPPSPSPPANVVGKKTFTNDPEDFFFSPNVLTGWAGQQLTLTIDNQGEAATHTFTIASEQIICDARARHAANRQGDVPELGLDGIPVPVPRKHGDDRRAPGRVDEWRWRESNPRARATVWGFSGRSRCVISPLGASTGRPSRGQPGCDVPQWPPGGTVEVSLLSDARPPTAGTRGGRLPNRD